MGADGGSDSFSIFTTMSGSFSLEGVSGVRAMASVAAI